MGFKLIKNWYQAYDECQKMGASLAVIDSQYKVEELLWYMKHHWTFRTVDLMFIGLIHEKWIPVDPNIGLFIVITCTFGNTGWVHTCTHVGVCVCVCVCD